MDTLVLSSFQSWKEALPLDGKPIPVHFVPTMGALHDGHGALIRAARQKAGDLGHVVVSVYVNPTQFNDAGDLSAYPRTQDADVALARRFGADAVVFPTSEEMYPEGVPAQVAVSDYGALTQRWEAAHRPGHFDGVVAVVRTLFEATKPTCAYFGEKDWQQLAVIRRLAKLEFPALDIVAVPTVREPGGLAMSSRNARLSDVDRLGATALHSALNAVVQSGGDGSEVDVQRARLNALGFGVEYLAVVDAETLEPGCAPNRGGRVIVAAHWAGVRLIDNAPLAG